MRYQITLDAGTTNTRAFLWEDGRILRARRKQEIGVSCTAADGDNHRLREAIRACVDGVLQDAGVKAGQVECILASGMVTSDMGLRELPHLTVPVELEQLAQGICRETFPSISSIPFLFIPGVKKPGTG